MFFVKLSLEAFSLSVGQNLEHYCPLVAREGLSEIEETPSDSLSAMATVDDHLLDADLEPIEAYGGHSHQADEAHESRPIELCKKDLQVAQSQQGREVRPKLLWCHRIAKLTQQGCNCGQIRFDSGSDFDLHAIVSLALLCRAVTP
jgi:hypothetical protein